MSTLTPFDFEGQQVRVLDIDNEPWFVASDVTPTLGYQHSPSAIRRLDADEHRQVAYALVNPTVRPGSGPQSVTVVSESGLYSLILWSQKEEAKPFRRWITSEVLPQIRKTGSYGNVPQLTGKQLLAAALLEADQVMKDQAATIETQRVELAAAAPKVHAWDGIISGVGDYTITDAAKVLARAGVATGPRKLHQQMLAIGWLYKNQRDKWTARQARVNDGCLAERARYYTDEDGVSTLAAPQVRITAKGLERLRDALAPQPVLTEGAAA